MGKLTIKKSLRRSSAKVLNFILLFSLIVPNVFAPAMVIAQDLDLVQNDAAVEIPIDESEDILEDGINTSIFEEETLENSFEDGIYTVNTVSLGEYVYPDNPLVKVNFTEITQEGNLVIERVILTQEQKVELNTTESFAWDITSSMSNGSFKYDLTLPNSLGNDIEVKYSEDGSTYENTGEFTVNEDSLVITDLDHFTLFVVGGLTNSPTCTGALVTPPTGTTECYSTIDEAVDNATDGSTIYVSSNTYVLTSTINFDTPNVSLIGIDEPIIQVSGTNHIFMITAPGNTIDGFKIEKTDKTGVQNILYIGANNTTIQNNTISGQFVIGDPEVSRAMVFTGGLSGLLITENTIYDLRQPGYISGVTTGTISNNYVYRTKGWVVEQGDLTFTNNTWGTGLDSNVYDIAILATTGPAYYPDIVAMSGLNNNAFIEDQRTIPATLSIVYVDGMVASSGDGTARSPKKTIQEGIQRVAETGIIILESDLDVSSEIKINIPVTIEGNDFSIFSKFAFIDNSNNSAIGIQANNVTLRNLTIDGTDGTNLHGINIYTVTDIVLDNISSINNDKSGIVVNGSIVTARDITTSGNLWHGINVDQGSGVTSEARLTIEQVSNHSDLYHILIDNINENSSVVDINNQYDYADYGNTRIYTLKPPVLSIPVLESPINDDLINNNTPLMQWEDSTVTVGSIKGYYYRIFHHCTDISNIPASCSVFPNSTGLWRTISEYQAGTTADGTYYWQVKAVDMNDNESEWSNLEKFTIDTIVPSAPTGLQRRALDNSVYQCGDTAKLQTLIPDWDDNAESDISYYEYTSFHPNGSIGINEQKVYSSEFLHNWIPTVEGTYGYAVRAVDIAGNKSPWSLSGKTLEGSCQITYDSTGPVAPVITFPTEGQYFNSTPILNDWTNSSDISGIKEYRIEYIYDDGHTFSGAPYRITTLSQRNHTPGLWEQGGVTIRVQAFDNVGNEGAWSDPVHYYYDETKPSTPEVLGFKNPELSCGGYTNVGNTTVDWSDSIDTGYIGSAIKGYEYQINYPNTNGTRGLWTPFFNTQNSQYTGSLNEGRHFIRVRAQDMAGNWSDWSQEWVNPSSLTEQEKAQNCSIELDTIIPSSPLGLYFWDVDNNKAVQCEGYSNTHHINEHWDANLDEINLSHYEYSSFDAPNGSAGLVKSVFYTNSFNSSWWNIPLEGTYGFQVRTLDKAGNTSPWALNDMVGINNSCRITIDWTAPVVEITNPIDGSTVSGTVDFKGTVQDDNLSSYSYEISRLTDIISGGENTETGFTNQTIYSWNTTTYPNGIYQIKLKATDKAGNETEEVINVTVNNPEPEEEAQTLGVATENTPTNSPTLVRRVTTYVADVLGIGGGEEELLTQLPDETEDSEVKGSQTCDNPKLLSGYVYMDKNENSMWDEDEKIFSDVSLRIYAITNGIEETVKQVVTDENGMWEVKLCMGEYFVSLDSDTLPNRYVVDGDETKGIDISDMESEYNLNYQILDNRNFLQKYWPWILLLVGLIGTGVIVVADSKKKKAFV